MPKPIVLTACICIVAVLSSELVIAQAPLESSMIYKNVDGRDLRIDCTRPAAGNQPINAPRSRSFMVEGGPAENPDSSLTTVSNLPNAASSVFESSIV